MDIVGFLCGDNGMVRQDIHSEECLLYQSCENIEAFKNNQLNARNERACLVFTCLSPHPLRYIHPLRVLLHNGGSNRRPALHRPA
jgi:hypothetical protein